MLVSENNGKKLLGNVLVEAGLITTPQLDQALEEQKLHGGRIGFNLVRLGFLSSSSLVLYLQEHLGVGIHSASPAERQKAADALPRHLALYYKIAPIRLEDETLTVAISEIEHANLIPVLSEITGYRIDPLIYPEKEIRVLVDSSYSVPSEKGIEFLSFGDHIFTIVDAAKNLKALAPGQLKNELDVGEWFRSIVAEAIREKSREILIQPEAGGSSIYFKKESFQFSEFSLDPPMHDDLTFLLFRLARMNPIQQQSPQHGRFQLKVNDRKVVMVAGAFPTIYGMRFLLEMFDERMLRRSFDEVTNPYPAMRKHLDDFVSARRGMLLITGPPGSGRTSFLYSLLSRCKEQYSHIMTLEEAVRYPLSGISQTCVEEKGMESALEDILTQKPDLVAVHTLRTPRSVEIAFLIAARIPVICILSSYDSFLAVEWLCRHHLKSAVKAGLLHSVVSPRMIPQVCPRCAAPYDLSSAQKENLAIPGHLELKTNQGCDYCSSVDEARCEIAMECLRVDRDVLSWLETSHSASSLRQRARESGRKTLYDVALQIASRGGLDMVSVMKLQSVL